MSNMRNYGVSNSNRGVLFIVGDPVEVGEHLGNVCGFVNGSSNEYVSVRWADGDGVDSVHWTDLRFVKKTPETVIFNALIAKECAERALRNANNNLAVLDELYCKHTRRLIEKGPRQLESEFPEFYE